MRYSTAFKQHMVQRMSGPEGIAAYALAEEVGVSQTSLSRWLREAGTLTAMTRKKSGTKGKSKTARRPQDWSWEEKIRVLRETAELPDEELGAYLRREGVHESQLAQWRETAQAALEAPTGRRKRTSASPERKRIKELERELKRKEKALAEAAALLVLKKKVDAYYAGEDDGTE